MKILAIICNISLLLFTCLVLLTDGISREAGYIVLTVILILVPVLNAILIFRNQGKPPHLKVIAVIGNVVLVGLTCWALIKQYPHPREPGFLSYAVLVVLTPILSLV